MIGLLETRRLTIPVAGVELLALKKLALVSHALASRIGGAAGQEQRALAETLDDIIRKIELAVTGSTPPPIT